MADKYFQLKPVRTQKQLKRAERKRSFITGKRREKTIRKLRARDGNRCGICGRLLRDDVTIDHRVPISKGGKSVYKNLQLAHKACNNAKADN